MEKLTYSQEDFPASLIPQQEKEKEKMTSAIYGQRCLEQYARFPRVSLWAKTFAASLIGMEGWYSRRCALSWKVVGIKSRPLLYLRAASERHIKGKEYGLLLKTPCAADAYSENLSKKEQKFGNSGTLAQEVATGFIYQRGLLPTPATRDYKGSRTKEKIEERKAKGQVTDEGTLPGFFAQYGKSFQLNPQFVAEMMGFPQDWTISPFLSGDQKV